MSREAHDPDYLDGRKVIDELNVVSIDVHVPTQHEIETFTGRFIDTQDPKPESVAIEDIAHALANTCRYSGHCARFYSVAEHAVLASKYAEFMGWDCVFQYACLHHDDAEAYLGDIARPLKPLLGEAYKILTDQMDQAIVVGLELPFGPAIFHEPEIREADNFALMAEARELLPSKGEGWGGQAVNWDLKLEQESNNDIEDLKLYWPFGLKPQAAESLFLQRHSELEALCKTQP